MLRPTLFVILITYSVFSLSQSADTIIYSIVAAGNIKGHDKIWRNPDGSYGEWYQYNDRGRGDSVRIEFREDAEGFPLYIKLSGVDYFKNVVSEEFSITNGKALWKNVSENEERKISGKVFYSGLKCNTGHIVKAMSANGNKIKLLPYGEAELDLLMQHEISKDSKTRKLYLVRIKGFGFTPHYAWVDENKIDFASVNEWQSTIINGYENYIDELLQIQKKYEASFFNKLASTLPKKMEEWVLIKNVAVFDAMQAKLLHNKDVLIHNGIVQNIAEGNSLQLAKSMIIDGKGKTLLPGLWDMHTHMTDDLDGILHIAAGVTHIRDMGNSGHLLEMIKQIDSGNIVGPRVEIKSGFIDGAGPMAAPTGVLINDLEEGKKAIRDYAIKGYQQIKLYSSIKPEWVKPLADEARKYKLRVCGHIPAFMTATQAIKAGYDEVTHLNMLALNFFGDTVDTRIPVRFSLPAQKTASLDLQGKDMKIFIQLLKSKNIAVDPTLVVFEGLFTSRDRIVASNFKPIVDHLPIQMQRQVRAGGGGIPVPEGMDETYRKSFDAFLKITKMLFDNSIRILPGTDGLAGFDLHRELELYVQAGVPSNKVLQLATWGCAMYTGKSDKWGRIAIGKKADFILVEGNPVQNISAIRNIILVMSNGNIYDPAILYAAVSIKPF